MVVLETRLGLLHQPRSSADGSADAGRLGGENQLTPSKALSLVPGKQKQRMDCANPL